MVLRQWPEVVWMSEVIDSLVEHHLVRAEHGEDFDGIRYSLSGSIQASAAAYLQREYGDDVEVVYGQYAKYYAQFGEDDALGALIRHGGADRWFSLTLESKILERQVSALGKRKVNLRRSSRVRHVCDASTGPSETAIN